MKRWAGALLLAGLAGCAGPRPAAPEAAQVAVPDHWLEASGGGGEVQPRWWQAFHDPVLDHLVEQALAANPDIALADARIDEAQAQFESIAGQARPNLALVAEGVRERDVSPFGTPEKQTAGQAELQATWDLDPFGRLRNARRAATAGVSAARYQGANVRLGIASATASGYVMLRALDRRLELLEATRAVRAESLRIAQRRLETGYGTVLEAKQAEAELRGAEQLVPAVQLAIARQEHALALLLGGEPQHIERGQPLAELAIPDPGAGVPATLLRQRPDIAQAEAQLVAADRSLDAARAAFLPDIQLSAAGGFVASSLLEDPIRVYSAGAGILAPLFSGGRLQAQQHGAAARRDQAAFAWRKTVLQALRDTEDALVTVQRAGEEEAAFGRQRDAVGAALQVAQKRYREGYSPYLEQIDAQRNLLAVDLAMTQARSDRLLAAIYLFQSLGGGWQRDTP